MNELIKVVNGIPMIQPDVAQAYREYLIAKKKAQETEKELKAQVKQYMLDHDLKRMELDGMVFTIKNGAHRKYLDEKQMEKDGIDVESYRYEIVSDPSLETRLK